MTAWFLATSPLPPHRSPGKDSPPFYKVNYLELNTKYTNVSHRVSKRSWVKNKLKIANWFLSALDLISDSDKLNLGTFYSEHQLVNWNLLKMPACKYFQESASWN